MAGFALAACIMSDGDWPANEDGAPV